MFKSIKKIFEPYFQTSQSEHNAFLPSPFLDLPLDIWTYCIFNDNMTNSEPGLRTLINLSMTSHRCRNIAINIAKLLLHVQVPSGREVLRYINIKYSSSLFSSIKMITHYWGMCEETRGIRDSHLLGLQGEVYRYHLGEFRPIARKDIFAMHRLIQIIYETEVGCTPLSGNKDDAIEYDLCESAIDTAFDHCEAYLDFGRVHCCYVENLLTYKFLAEILYDMFKLGRIILPRRYVMNDKGTAFLDWLTPDLNMVYKKKDPKKRGINIFKRFLCPVIDDKRKTKLVYASIGDLIRLYYYWPRCVNLESTEGNPFRKMLINAFTREIVHDSRCIPVVEGEMFHEYSIDVHVPYLLSIYSRKNPKRDE